MLIMIPIRPIHHDFWNSISIKSVEVCSCIISSINTNIDTVPFYPYFYVKDLFSFLILVAFFSIFVFYFPNTLGHADNYIPANPLVTPVHIQPEWYFLIAYAILRSIPNKLGGVVALALSIAILLICPFIYTRKFKGFSFYPLNKLLFWVHINVWILLTWLGARPVESPYIVLGQVLSVIYFS